MKIKIFKPPDSTRNQIKRLIKRLIGECEDVSLLKMAYPDFTLMLLMKIEGGNKREAFK